MTKFDYTHARNKQIAGNIKEGTEECGGREGRGYRTQVCPGIPQHRNRCVPATGKTFLAPPPPLAIVYLTAMKKSLGIF